MRCTGKNISKNYEDCSACYQICCSRLGVTSKDDVYKQMRDDFIAAFENLQATRAQTEANINAKACNALKEAELQLNANCPLYGHGNSSMVYTCTENEKKNHTITCFKADAETDVRAWHAHQLKREDALMRIEMDTIEELSECWKKHDKKRTQLITDHVSGLSVTFLSQGKHHDYQPACDLSGILLVKTFNIVHLGMQLRDCDRILREHAQSRAKLREELEAGRLIQMAKFQARLDQHKERLVKVREQNQQLHSKKREMEKKIAK